MNNRFCILSMFIILIGLLVVAPSEADSQDKYACPIQNAENQKYLETILKDERVQDVVSYNVQALKTDISDVLGDVSINSANFLDGKLYIQVSHPQVSSVEEINIVNIQLKRLAEMAGMDLLNHHVISQRDWNWTDAASLICEPNIAAVDSSVFVCEMSDDLTGLLELTNTTKAMSTQCLEMWKKENEATAEVNEKAEIEEEIKQSKENIKQLEEQKALIDKISVERNNLATLERKRQVYNQCKNNWRFLDRAFIEKDSNRNSQLLLNPTSELELCDEALLMAQAQLNALLVIKSGGTARYQSLDSPRLIQMCQVEIKRCNSGESATPIGRMIEDYKNKRN